MSQYSNFSVTSKNLVSKNSIEEITFNKFLLLIRENSINVEDLWNNLLKTSYGETNAPKILKTLDPK